jgi:hypothetical protein
MEWFNAEGYVAAYRAFDEPAFLNKAIKNANFLANETITDSNEIMRNYKITKLPFMASSMIMRLLFQHLSNCIRLLLMKSGCIKQKN